MPHIHHREQRCRDAERALSNAILDWYKAHQDLTTAEHLQAVHVAFSDHVLGMFRHLIRIERHGNADKPGGLE